MLQMILFFSFLSLNQIHETATAIDGARYFTDETQKKVFLEIDNKRLAITPRQCTDYGILRGYYSERTDQITDYLLSYCDQAEGADRPKTETEPENNEVIPEKAGFYLFTVGTEKEVAPFAEFNRVYQGLIRLIQTKNRIALIHLTPAETDSLSYKGIAQTAFTDGLLLLTSKNRVPVKNFMIKSDQLVFIYSNNWYVMKISNLFSSLTRIHWYRAADQKEALRRFQEIQSYDFSSDDRYVYFRFSVIDKTGFGVYDIQQKKWEVMPSFALSRETWQQLEKFNTMVNLYIPGAESGNGRQYYEVFIDSEKVTQTEFFGKGAEGRLFLNLKPGRHNIELVRYITEAHEDTVRYVRDKNLYQLSPVQVDIKSDRVTLMYIDKGDAKAKKPFLLKTIHLTRP